MKKISRRNFIKISGLAGGGLIVGFNINAASNQTFTYNPNLFIQITSENLITLKILEQEMGQGVATSIVMLIAEELEVDIAQVKMEFLPYSKEIPNYQEKFGEGDSGGSYAMIRKWKNMRKAGATVREVLIKAAARKWDVSINDCYAKNGFVHTKKTSKKHSYGELCEAASREEIPEDVQLKEVASFKTIGKATPDIRNKFISRGSLKYSIDEDIPDMVYASIIMNPTKDASVMEYNSDEVLSMEGIFQVVEIEGTNKNDFFNGSEGGVAIIGNSTWNVFKAKKVLESKIVWNYGEFGNKSLKGIKQEFKEALEKPMNQGYQRGDVSQSFAVEIVKEISATYETPYLAHALMEPLNAIVHVKNNACEIWAGTQSPQYTSYFLSQILNIPLENFIFHPYPSGGGFGRRFCTDFVTQAALISQKVKKPVKLTWTREDEIQHGRYQSLREEHYRGGLDKNNNFVAIHYKGISTAGYAPKPNFLYHIPNYKEEHRNLVSIVHDGTWRSVGQYHAMLGRECFIDEMAHLAKNDPMDFRIEYLQKELDSFIGSNDEDAFVKFRRNQIAIYFKILKALKDKVKWEERLPEGEGLGLAISDYGGNEERIGHRNSVCGQVAHIKIKNGIWEIKKLTVVVDCGLVVNPSGAKAQVEGSINWALNPIIYDGIDIEKGQVLQSNFHDFKVLRISGAPEVEAHFLPSTDHPTGMGETAVPPATPAILNGIFAASGIRVRKLPVNEWKYRYS